MNEPDVTIRFTHEMQELLNKALNDGLTYREGAFMMQEIQKHIEHHHHKHHHPGGSVTLNLPASVTVSTS
jgi:hypothetical protein